MMWFFFSIEFNFILVKEFFFEVLRRLNFSFFVDIRVFYMVYSYDLFVSRVLYVFLFFMYL